MRRQTIGLLTTLLALGYCGGALAQDYPQPSAEHELLGNEVGDWDAKMTMWPEPGAEPMTQPASETNTMFGSFWLLSEFKCENGAFPFSGRMQLGYDSATKQYVGTWIDTVSPYLSNMTGKYDAENQSLTMVSKGRDFMTGEMKTSTMVTKFVNEDTKTFTMYGGTLGDDGQPDEDTWKMMEIKYQRRK